jgi:glycosyltransferase involved in cell wall biosynthesis
MARKRIVFYIEPEWAYGVIHYDLVKLLHEQGVIASLLPWNRAYTVQEITDLVDVVDAVVTVPHGLGGLQQHFNVSADRCIVMCHSIHDLELLQGLGDTVIAQVIDYAVVSEFLKQQSIEMGITRIPKVTVLGIMTEAFATEPAKQLSVLGYAGAWSDERGSRLIKRTELIRQVCDIVKLELRVAATYHNSFVTMAGFYRTVDGVLVASAYEGAGLPCLEAAAAGRLVVSTPVGHWDRVTPTGAIEVPIDAEQYVSRTVETIVFYQNNPAEYRNRCAQILEHAKRYDWQYHIHDWVELFTGK